MAKVISQPHLLRWDLVSRPVPHQRLHWQHPPPKVGTPSQRLKKPAQDRVVVVGCDLDECLEMSMFLAQNPHQRLSSGLGVVLFGVKMYRCSARTKTHIYDSQILADPFSVFGRLHVFCKPCLRNLYHAVAGSGCRAWEESDNMSSSRISSRLEAMAHTTGTSENERNKRPGIGQPTVKRGSQRGEPTAQTRGLGHMV